MEPGLNANAVFSSKTQNFPNGCHVVELEIDEHTGVVEFVRYSVVDDVGTIINPLLVYGQITGGVAQGIGQILMEDIHFDKDSGQLTTGSFMDYAMPRADTFPTFSNTLDDSVPAKTNPLGAKGVGEGGVTGSMPCLMNAVLDALRPVGVTRFDMPASAAVAVPLDINPSRAVLAANMETALNATWDAAPGPYGRIAVVGAGVIGALVAFICARIDDAEHSLELLACWLACRFRLLDEP